MRKLSALQSGSDEDIFAVVSSHVAPFTALRATLQQWAESLPAGPLREAAEDVLLCFQVELLCDDATSPGLPSHAVIDPDVAPLFWTPRPAGLPGLLCGASWRGLAFLCLCWISTGVDFLCRCVDRRACTSCGCLTVLVRQVVPASRPSTSSALASLLPQLDFRCRTARLFGPALSPCPSLLQRLCCRAARLVVDLPPDRLTSPISLILFHLLNSFALGAFVTDT